MLCRVQGTIFGAPVVPPVNMIMASSSRRPCGAVTSCVGAAVTVRSTVGAPSSGPTVTVTGQQGALSGAVWPSPSRSTSTARAPTARLRDSWSAAGRAGSSGATTRSARDAASSATTNSGLLPARSPTRSPGPKPAARSRAARSSTSRTRSAYAIGLRSEATSSAGARGALRGRLDQVGQPRSGGRRARCRLGRHRHILSRCAVAATMPGAVALRPIPIRSRSISSNYRRRRSRR